MTDTASLARTLILLGLVVAGIGLVLLVMGRVPFLGRLPGDITIQRENWGFYFPIVTCIVLSLVLTLVLNLFRR